MVSTLNSVKAMADGSRLRVVAALLRYEELCVCQIIEVLALSGGTVSRHMSILQNAGLVQSRKDGRWVYYRLAEYFPLKLREWLMEALANSREIEADRLLLDDILSCGPENLCIRQKEKKEMVYASNPKGESV